MKRDAALAGRGRSSWSKHDFPNILLVAHYKAFKAMRNVIVGQID